jgi:tetratricopeptide (TPR) repeat protein
MAVRDYTAAVRFFERSNKECGAHHVTQYNLGLCFHYMGEIEKASEKFQEAIEIFPEYAEAKGERRATGTSEEHSS